MHNLDAKLKESQVKTESQYLKTPQGFLLGHKAGAPTAAAADYAPSCIFQDTTNAVAYINTGTKLSATWVNLAASAVSLNGAYDNGAVITVDSTAVTFTGSHAINYTLIVTNSNAAGTGALIDLTHARAASKDIDGTGSLWYVTAGGAFTAASFTSTAAIVAGTTLTATTSALVGTTLHVVGDVTFDANLTVSGTWGITTTFSLGTDGVGVDMNFYTLVAGDKILWDASEKTLYFVDTKAHFEDGDELHFGTGTQVGSGDFKIYSNGTDCFILAVANVASQTLYVGDATNELDLIWRSTTSGAEVTYDSSGDVVIFDGVNCRHNDDDYSIYGDDGDFTLRFNGVDLFLLAGADVADQAVKIGSAANDVDLIVYGDTANDYLQWDSSANVLKIVNATASSNSLVITNVATGAHAVSVTGSGALTDNFAVIYALGTGNLAAGGNVVRAAYTTGAPDTDARIVEVVGAGKDLRGIFYDVDTATLDSIAINCGGNIANTKSLMLLTADGTPVAGSRMLTITAAKDIYGLYVDVDPTTNDGNYFNTGSNLAAGKAVIRIAIDAGTPDTTAALLRADAAKDMYGIYSDVNPTINPANYFNCGADLAAGTAVIYATVDVAQTAGGSLIRAVAERDIYGLTTDVDATGRDCNKFNTSAATGAGFAILKLAADAGTPNATAHILFADWTSAGSLANNPVAVHIKSSGTGAQLLLTSTDTGTLGTYIRTDHTPGAAQQADGDVVFRLANYGWDDANPGAANQYAQFDIVAADSAAASEDARLDWYACVAGSIATSNMTLEGSTLSVGCGATGYFTSKGDFDVVLKTGNATTGTITITDGAAGAITVSPNGTGSAVVNGLAAKFHGTAITPANDGAIAVTESVRYYDTTAGACADTLPDISVNYGYFLAFYFLTDGAADAVIATVGADVIVESSGDAANAAVTMNDAGDFCVLWAAAPGKWIVVVNSGCAIA